MRENDEVFVERVGQVVIVEIRRPPHNFFDANLINAIADVFDHVDRDRSTRAIVLSAQGTTFCAGADLRRGRTTPEIDFGRLYAAGARLMATRKPIVGAIQGPAVGGGLGLALVPDFRVVTPDARFSANFVKLGTHPGFGLTLTLPRLIGSQKAAILMYTGRRLNGEQALTWGLADELVDRVQLRGRAVGLAAEIAEAAPLAVASTRAMLRHGLVSAFRKQTSHEAAEQTRLAQTADCREGVRAVAERRLGRFIGA